MEISIKNISLQALIGTNPHERVQTQPIVVNVLLQVDGSRCAATDDLADSVDYAQLTDRISSLVTSSSFQLLESLATAILDLIMQDSRIVSATVEVDKPEALPGAESVSVKVFSKES